MLKADDYDSRHWRFIYESLHHLNKQLSEFNHQITIAFGECLEVFNHIANHYQIHTLFSHEETGLKITYERDKNVKQWCKGKGVEWLEFTQFGVDRARKNRENWSQSWYIKMSKPIKIIHLQQLVRVDGLEELAFAKSLEKLPSSLKNSTHCMQKGGSHWAYRYLHTFLNDRSKNYNQHISKPSLSRKSCSRLSPYIAYGNISIRSVYQTLVQEQKKGENKKNLSAFASRLRWHCHFIQKFESEERYEFENINKGNDKLLKNDNEAQFEAWKRGNTGIPLVDASMRCLIETGYLNFRMRAMLVSFLCHHLWMHWKKGAVHLGKMFLDFEPGIHYPQMQMQAGVTGINTIRIYNPIKQSYEHDADAEFIKKWVPELANLPIAYALEPWKITPLEKLSNEYKDAMNYPNAIIDISRSSKKAAEMLYKMKNDEEVKAEKKRILKLHTTANRFV